MINRYERYLEHNPTIPYSEWEDLLEVTISGLYLDKLDLDMFPDNIASITIRHGHILEIVSSTTLSNLSRLLIHGVGVERFNVPGNKVPELSWLSLRDNRMAVANIPTAKIYNLDLSNNNLKTIHMTHQRKQMICMDVSNNPDLSVLPSINTLISSLDISGCPNLMVDDHGTRTNVII